MSNAVSHVTERAAELRREFDRAFAEPVQITTEAKVELLGIRVAGQACAIRLAEIAGLFAGKKITRIPGGNAALRGIAGFRGVLLPVYDLHTLLGHASAQTPRWLVIASAAPIALAFETFERQLRVSRDQIVPHSSHPDTPNHAREIVRTDMFAGPIVHLGSLLDSIMKLKAQAAPRQE